jgi:competence protein ComFA
MQINVAGQLLTESELAWSKLPDNILTQARCFPAIDHDERRGSCGRCGARLTASDHRLPDGRWYCTECIVLGRVLSGEQLWWFPNQSYAATELRLSWTGELTPAQARVAAELISSFDRGSDHLLWAVTGAGKTEMLFPLLLRALRRGVRVAVVSPRVDVILELAPRLAAAFADCPPAIRYGGSGPIPVGQFLLATVHQLLRFKASFGLIVVDEVDAFPYAGDPMLERAVRRAATGSVFFLSATPSASLLKQVRRKEIGISYLPRRFHGHPLPVPRVCFAGRSVYSVRIMRRIVKEVVIPCARCLIFVPAVRDLEVVRQLLAKIGVTAETVHAQEALRQERVDRLRAGTIQVLISTTILERGVTFADCGVVVLQADAPLFASSALVQMAGRAGRNKLHPDNPVLFVSCSYTRAMATALRQIKAMNRRGKA